MILGLCGSFAVVPVVSVVNGGGSSSRLAASPRQPGGSANPASLDSAALNALLLSGAALAAALPSGSGIRSEVSLDDAASAPAANAAASGKAPSGAKAAPSTSASAAAKAPQAAAAPAEAAPAPAPATPAPAPAPAPATAHAVTPHAATASHTRTGIASWYDIAAGTCANNDAPMGTILTVTSSAGISVTCKVVSTGPFGPGRIVDLAKATFALLSPVSRGLVTVTVTW